MSHTTKIQPHLIQIIYLIKIVYNYFNKEVKKENNNKFYGMNSTDVSEERVIENL